jgi:hypothetical protein
MGARPERIFTVIETVRCLVCDTVYAKPRLGGTAATNPGCPDCGYLGWSAVSGKEPEPFRSFADPLRTRLAR